MAQVLKNELRIKIIESGKNEFLLQGYENASMRTIAKNANMTVGNLYRYFDNKEALFNAIVGSTLKDLNNLIKVLFKNSLSVETRVFDVRFNTRELINLLEQFADRVVALYSQNKAEFEICLRKEDIKNNLINWFSNVSNTLITVHYGSNNNVKQIEYLSRSYGASIYSGFYNFFMLNNDDNEFLADTIKAYFKSIIALLESDFKNYVNK